MTISCEAVILSCCLVMVFAANVVQRTCAVVVKYDNLGHAKPQVMIYPLQDIWIVLHDSTYPDSRACAKQENFVCPKTAMHTLKYHLLRFLQGPDGMASWLSKVSAARRRGGDDRNLRNLVGDGQF